MRRLNRVRLVGAIAVLCAVVAAVISPRADAATPVRYLNPVFASMSKVSNLYYGQALNSKTHAMQALRLDLYTPAGDVATSRPAVVFAHGGAFTGGDKADATWLPVYRELTHRGYVVAAINYRLTGSATDATYDMLAAVRYLKRYAASYKVDPNHVIVMGSSSGAQMALQADFDSETPGTSGNPGYSSNPAGAVAVSWSVLTGMEAGDSPVEVFQALDDPAQPFPLAEGMCTEDQALGNTCVVQIYQDGGHGKDLLAAHGPAVMQQTADFLCRTVLGPKICKVPA